MADELSLFGDDTQVEPAKDPVRVAPQGEIADWLVVALRQALDARGVTDLAERQRAIEAAAGRPVAHLRELTRGEALRALATLTPDQASAAGSSWDKREDDTWIDNL